MPNLIAFGLGLGIAYFLKWEVKDLVWSLWLCSLVIGYLTMLSALGAGAYIGLRTVMHKDFKKEQRIPVIIGGAVFGLFFLSFFSIHFGGFHAGHSIFLQIFFPVEGMPATGFERAFMNPPLLWAMVFRYLIKPYGLFLIPTIIVERQLVFRPLISAVRSFRNGGDGDHPEDFKTGQFTLSKHPMGDAMFRPYINVVRMHLLIFFFAFSAIIQIESFVVYATVYFVYFFPWSEIWRTRRLKVRHKDVA